MRIRFYQTTLASDKTRRKSKYCMKKKKKKICRLGSESEPVSPLFEWPCASSIRYKHLHPQREREPSQTNIKQLVDAILVVYF